MSTTGPADKSQTQGSSRNEALESSDNTLGIGFIDDFRRIGQQLTEVDVTNWLESDSQDFGYELLDDD